MKKKGNKGKRLGESLANLLSAIVQIRCKNCLRYAA